MLALILTSLVGCPSPEDTADSAAEDCGTAYRDRDGDGFGDPDAPASKCGDHWVEQAGDCDDDAPAVHPGATETCSQRDEDCDGQGQPEGAEGCVDTWQDLDGDGYGSGEASCVCEPGPAEVTIDGDCAPTDPAATTDCTARVLDESGSPLHFIGVVRDAAGFDHQVALFPDWGPATLIGVPEAGDVPLPDSTIATFAGDPFTFGLGDLDGDGLTDLLQETTAWELDIEQAETGDYGWTTPGLELVFGPLEAAVGDAPVPVTLGTVYGQECAAYVFAADVDGDGRDEAVGGCGKSFTWSEAAMWSVDAEGSVTELARVAAARDAALFSPASVSDLDGDGREDFSTCGFENDYVLRFHLGPLVPGFDSEPDATLGTDDLGVGITPLGDLDGDGLEDFVANEDRQAWLISGLPGDGPIADAAYAVLVPESYIVGTFIRGDLGADGSAELIVGNRRAGDHQAGVIYQLDEPPSGTLLLEDARVLAEGHGEDDYLEALAVLDDGRLLAWSQGAMHPTASGILWAMDLDP